MTSSSSARRSRFAPDLASPEAATNQESANRESEWLDTDNILRRAATSRRRGCCKTCSTGKACGDSCIGASLSCYAGTGCACNSGETSPATTAKKDAACQPALSSLTFPTPSAGAPTPSAGAPTPSAGAPTPSAGAPTTEPTPAPTDKPKCFCGDNIVIRDGQSTTMWSLKTGDEFTLAGSSSYVRFIVRKTPGLFNYWHLGANVTVGHDVRVDGMPYDYKDQPTGLCRGKVSLSLRHPLVVGRYTITHYNQGNDGYITRFLEFLWEFTGLDLPQWVFKLGCSWYN